MRRPNCHGAAALSAWLLPLVAPAFWVGILAWPALHRGGVAPSWLLAAGAVVLLFATALAPWPDRGPEPLASAGLVPTEPAPIRALANERTTWGRAPPLLLCIAAAIAFL